ncbi:mucin-17 [Schistocerca nitens]|uniref:mucin-17 n=1 Tax=Schistocerca nitens TaxID=7011 RepID=UPI002118EC5F|nr:mucin-17 [Schistocerca nitens]
MAAREKKPAASKQLGNRRDADSSKTSLTVSTIKKFNSLADAKKDLLKLSEDVASATKKPIPGAFVRRRKNSVASVAASEPGVGTLNSKNLLTSSSKINPRVVAKKSGIGGNKITRIRADSLVTNGVTYKSPYGTRSDSKGLRSGKRRDGKGLIEFGERPLEYSLKKRRITVGPTSSASVPTSANTTPSQTPPGTPVVKSAPNSEPPQQSRPRLLLTELPKTQPLISFDSPSQFLRRNSDSVGGGSASSPGGTEGTDGVEVDGPDPVLGRAISSKITALIKRSKATAILQKFSEMRAERKAAEAAATQLQAKAGGCSCNKPVDTNSNLCTDNVKVKEDSPNKNISPVSRGTVAKKTVSEGQKTSNLVDQKSGAKTEGKNVSKTPVAVKEVSSKTESKDVPKTPTTVKEVTPKTEGKNVSRTPVIAKEESAKSEGRSVSKTPVTVKEASAKAEGKSVSKTTVAVKEASVKAEGKDVPKTPMVVKEASAKMESKCVPKKVVAVKEANVKTESRNVSKSPMAIKETSAKTEGKDVPKTPVAVKEVKPQPLKSVSSATNVKTASPTVNCKQKENTPVFASTMKPISPVKSRSPSTKAISGSGKTESVQDTDTEGEPGEPSFPPEGRVRPGMPRPDTPRPKFSRSHVEPTKKLAIRRLEVSEGLGVPLGGTAVPLGSRLTRKKKAGKTGGLEIGESAAKRKRMSSVSAAAMGGLSRQRLVRAGPSGVIKRTGLSAVIKRARGQPFVRAATPMRAVRRTPSTSPEKLESGTTVKKAEEAADSKQVPKTGVKLKTDLPDSVLETKSEKLVNGDLSPGKPLIDQLKNKLSKLSKESKADIKELKDDTGSKYKLKNLVNDVEDQSHVSLKSSKESDHLCLKDECKPSKLHADSCKVKLEDSLDTGKLLATKVNATAKELCDCKLPCSKEAKYTTDESSLKFEKKETVFCNKVTDTKDDSERSCANSAAEAGAATKDVEAVVVKEKEDVVMKEVEDIVMKEVDVPLVSDVREDCVNMDVVCDNSQKMEVERMDVLCDHSRKMEVKETKKSNFENSPVNNNVIGSPIKTASSKSVCDSVAVSSCANDTKDSSSTELPPVTNMACTELPPISNADSANNAETTQSTNDKGETVQSETVVVIVEKKSIETNEGVALKTPEVKQNLTSERISSSPAKCNFDSAVAPTATKCDVGASGPVSKGSNLESACDRTESNSAENVRTVPKESKVSSVPLAIPVSSTVVRIVDDVMTKGTILLATTGENAKTVSTENKISCVLPAVPVSSTVVRAADDVTAKGTSLPASTVLVRPANSFVKFTQHSRFQNRAAVKRINRRRSLDPCNKQRLLYKDRLGQMRLHRKRSLSEGARLRLLQKVQKSPAVNSTSRKVTGVWAESGDKAAHVNASRVQGDFPVANMCITNYLIAESDVPVPSKKEPVQAAQIIEHPTPTSGAEAVPAEMEVEFDRVRATTTADLAASESLGSKESGDEASIASRDEAVVPGPGSDPPEVIEESMDTFANTVTSDMVGVEACGDITDSITDTENSLTSVEGQVSDLTPSEVEINNAFSFGKCEQQDASCAESASDTVGEVGMDVIEEKSIPESESVEPATLMSTAGVEDSIAEDVSMELPAESTLRDEAIKTDDLFMDIEALSSCRTGELASFGSVTCNAAPTTEPGTEQEQQLSSDVKCVLEEILDRIAKKESGGITNDEDLAATISEDTPTVTPEVSEPVKLPEATPEEQAEKVSILWALGLTMRHAVPPPPPVPKSAPYTGTLKTVIKESTNCNDIVQPQVQRTSPEKRRRSLKMVLKQGSAPNGRREGGGHDSGEEKVEYRICKENELLTGDPSNFGVNNKKLVKNSSHKSFHELSTNSPYVACGKDEAPAAALGTSSIEGVSNGAAPGKDDVAKPPVDLIIPEKSASFSIHPGRLCSDVCSYCFGKFGSLDTPCHIAQLKTAERQRKVLEIETHLTAESCLCDACYRHVDRKANCPSYKDNRKRYHRTGGGLGGATAVCAAQGCDQTASHHVRRKWLLKLKRSIMNKVPVDTDKPQAHFALCSQHFSWVDFYMVCGICNRRLVRAHMYGLGNAEARELNAALTRDGIPARVSSERFLCKLCRYYASLRAKCRNPSNLTGNQKMFFDSYRKRILQYHDIEVPSGSENEEGPQQSKESSGQNAQQQSSSTGQPKPKRRRTKADSSTTKETQETAPKSGDSTANNSTRLDDSDGITDGTAQQGSGAVMMDYSNLATFGNNLTVTPIPASTGPVGGRRQSSGASSSHHTGDEDQPPPVQASFEFHGAGGAPRGGGEWEQCTASLQFTADTKRLFQTLQRPYGSHSSFMRHLLLLEKYWRQGDLVLSPRASHRAATYVSSVQHRLRAFDYNPLQNNSRPQQKPLTSSPSASDAARRGMVTETNSVSVIPVGVSGEPEPHVLELPLRSPPATASPLAVQGQHIVSRSPGTNGGMRKVILDGKVTSPTGGYMLSMGRGGVLVPTNVMQVGGRTYLYTPPSASNARRVAVTASAPATAASTGRLVTSPSVPASSPIVPRISSVRSLAPRAWDRAAGSSSSSSSATTTVTTKSSQPRLSVTVVPKSGTTSTSLPKGSVPGPKPSTIVTPTGIVLSRNLDVTMSPVSPQ